MFNFVFTLSFGYLRKNKVAILRNVRYTNLLMTDVAFTSKLCN